MKWLGWVIGGLALGLLVWFYFLGEKETKEKMERVRQAKADKKFSTLNDNDDVQLRVNSEEIKPAGNEQQA